MQLKKHLCTATAPLVAILAIAFSLMLPLPALAQCSSAASSVDQGGPGQLVLQASTTQQGCTGRTTQVAAWMGGHTFDCDPETFDSQGNCFVTSTTANAVVRISSFPACGSWNGMSNHYYVENGTRSTVQENRTTVLNAGSCGGPDCSALGADYWWDGFECTNQASPIIIRTRPGSYKLTSASDGVIFDIDGNGVLAKVAWTEPDSDLAFLAIDLDGDGQITSGKELFGNHTVLGALNGWDALSELNMQTNGGVRRGSVSSDDPLFARLLLWTDRNHNGISEPDELQPLSVLFSEIGVGYTLARRTDKFGNTYRFKGWVHVRTAPGRNIPKGQKEDRERTRPAYDVLLSRQP